MMGPLRFACESVPLDGLRLPPFQLHAGEALCLHLPPLKTWTEREQLVKALAGPDPVEGLTRLGRIIYAEPPQGRGGLCGLWPSPRIVDWLCRRAGLDAAEAREVVTRLGLSETRRVSHVAMNPRTLLGLEAAYARGAEVVLFSTAGCDPLGTRAAFEMVLARLHRCSAIHLSYPYTVNDEVQRACLPGARCVEVVRQAATSAAAVSGRS